jgi:hypothetical protein
MPRNKVIEFYVELDDIYLEFTKMIENRPKIEDLLIKRCNRSGNLSKIKAP